MAEPASLPLDEGSRRWSLLVAGACLLPLLLQLPGPTAGAIAATAAIITALSWRRPLSTPVRVLLAIAVVAAVLAQFGMRFGRDTGAALLGAMLALKPSETTSLRDARSLVGFALFAPFATFLLDQGPLTLALGLAAVLLALGALQRLAALENGVEPGPLAAPMRQALRLVLLGLPVALAVFWLFPRIASPLWGVPDRAQARTGLSDSMSPGDWVDLLTDDSVAARVRFFGATPPRDAMYWRGPVLWDFDGRTWTQPRGFDFRAPPPVQPSPVRWDYQIDVEPTDRRQLVALDLPLAAPADTRLTLSHSLVTMRPLAGLTRWRMASSPPQRFQATLPDALRRRALALPGGYNPRTLALARELRQRHGADDAAIANHALDWIRREFAYSLAAPPLGEHTVDEFLFGTRTGYCEHFAGAFTILMRAAGIPARVVTGYAGGEHNAIGDYWMLRNSDAHAWVEVWLAGRGWTRVDPTAAVAPERIHGTAGAARTGGLFDTLQAPGGLAQVGDWMRRNWNDLVLGFDAQRQERMFRPLGLDRITPAQLAIVFAVAAVLALALMVGLSLRMPREPDPVMRAWRRLNARYARLGLGREPYEPATAWAERIAKRRPAEAARLPEITARFTRWRYAGVDADSESARRLARDLASHRPTRTHAPDALPPRSPP